MKGTPMTLEDTLEDTPKYKLRKLTIKDFAPISRIISKVGVKEFAKVLQSDELMETFRGLSGNSDNDVTYAGISAVVEVIGVVLENYEKAEADLLSFLASMAGISAKELGDEEPAVLVELIKGVVTQDGFMGFLKQLGLSLG